MFHFDRTVGWQKFKTARHRYHQVDTEVGSVNSTHTPFNQRLALLHPAVPAPAAAATVTRLIFKNYFFFNPSKNTFFIFSEVQDPVW